MLPVSRRFLANLRGATRWVTRAEWSRDLRTWNPMTVASGSVTADRGSTARWSANLAVDADSVTVDPFGFAPYGARMRLHVGMWFAPDDIEWVPLGVYRVEEIDDETGAPTLTVTGTSMESQVNDDKFTAARSFPAQSARSLLEQLVRESVPDAQFHWTADGSIRVPLLTSDSDRWSLVDGDDDAASVAKAIAGECYTDARGAWCIAPVPDGSATPVWTAHTGPDGVLVKLSGKLSRTDVTNVWVVTGEAAADTDVTDATDTSTTTPANSATEDTTAVGPVIAQDTDPGSPTYIYGPFGRKVDTYSSSLITTNSQCANAARAKLASSLGLTKSLDFTSVINPALEPGDTIEVIREDGTRERHVIDQFSISLPGVTMDATTRDVTTRLGATAWAGYGAATGAAR